MTLSETLAMSLVVNLAREWCNWSDDGKSRPLDEVESDLHDAVAALEEITGPLPFDRPMREEETP